MLMPILFVVSLIIIYIILTPFLCHYITDVTMIAIVILALLIIHVFT